MVDSISLAIREGEMMCLLGPSGCGKTTTLRIVAGFEAVDGGTVRLGGSDVTRLPPEKRDIGLVFQDYALFPHLTVAQNVGFGLRMRRVRPAAIAAAVRDALALVHLDGVGDRLPRQLSGGQRQRVALARAIAIRPRLLLLDEPLSNLDAGLRDAMRDEIRRVQRSVGITTLFVTHDQQEALPIADRMAVMRHGRIMQLDTPARVYESPADPFVAGFIGEANLLPGLVEAVVHDRLALQTRSGQRLVGTGGAALQRGQAALAVVKADRVRLSRVPAKAGAVCMKMQVDAATFLGATIAYACSVDDVQLNAVASSAAPDRFVPGETIFESWSIADCLILADDVTPIPTGDAS